LNSGDWKKPEYKMTEKPAPILSRYFELIDFIKRDCAVDADRIYVTGYSMGAYATLECVIRRPKFFAAALPVAGDADLSKLNAAKHTATWLFFGEKDDLVPISKARRLIKKLESINPGIKTTILENEGHNIASLVYKDAEVWEWLFAQSRQSIESDPES